MNIFEDTQGVPVFEIPIYAFTKEEYRKRWLNKERKDRDKLLQKGYSVEHAENAARHSSEYESIWQYNRMVGMFLLTVKKENCLYCHLYCNPMLPRTITQHTYLPFINKFLFQERISLKNVESDTDLLNAIKSKIEFFKTQYELNSCYFDCSALENSISLTKIREAISRNSKF